MFLKHAEMSINGKDNFEKDFFIFPGTRSTNFSCI